MLQDILPHQLDIAFHPVAPRPDSLVLAFDGEQLLAARREEGLLLPRLAAQPWAFSDSLLLGFFAELDGPDALTLQRSELSEAAWIPRAQIRHQPEDFSLTGELVDRFVRGEMPR